MAPLVKLENVGLERFGRKILRNIDWEIHPQTRWAITGPNGSGKSVLMQVLGGRMPCSRGTITWSDEALIKKTAYVSFEIQQEILASELKREFSREFSGRIDEKQTVRQILEDEAVKRDNKRDIGNIVGLLDLSELLDSSLLALSNGEMRKTIIARALLRRPDVLILDEPYDGLDARSKKHLTEIIEDLVGSGTQVLLVTLHDEEISDSFDNIICLENGEISFKGDRKDFQSKESGSKTDAINKQTGWNEKFPAEDTSTPAAEITQVKTESNKRIEEPNRSRSEEPTIEMKNVIVSYGSTVVLDNLSWIVKRCENWAIVGPNGSGKTTLLRLISADHPQAYSNDIKLFGRQRGTGESIWEIKSRMGILSPELQNRYTLNLKAIDIVLSGYFDSIGLYRYTSSEQRTRAAECLAFLRMQEYADSYFNALSYGQKRMLLLARALVKSPEMLLLDEPCQGLDPLNSRRLIEVVSEIARFLGTQILYITHRLEELPSCITHRLDLERNRENETHTSRFTARISKI